MSYKSESIKEVVDMIGKNKVYLPAIQRKFVWKPKQIESLFDSIMRGYPIGTFLFWYLEGEKINNYTFYKFIQDYHERDRSLNDTAPKPELKKEIIGVLDGQQRLSSMYIALQGTYSYKKPRARWNNDDAFPKRKFYLNLLKDLEGNEVEDFVYEFRFLTDEEAKHADEKHLWFLVSDVLTWGKDPEMDEYYDKLLENDNISECVKDVIKTKRANIKKILRVLHQRLVIEEIINYYKIEDQDLDEILDIFVRVNSGGTPLSKSDLLFSTIVANWEDGRQEIDSFLQSINRKGGGFRFNNDFIMRSCLVLTDCPVLFKVESFKKENICKIKDEWNNIKSSIRKTVDLLVEFGFNGENLTSQNAVIPIAYHFIKGGDDSEESKKDIKKYLIHALLKQIYGGKGDNVLSNIRDTLRQKDEENNGQYQLKQNTFSFESLLKAKLPEGKSLKITDEDIEEILEYKKGPYTFMVLSLLYPNLRFGQVKFHQDHIHPASLFTNTNLKKYDIPKEKLEKWQDMKDRLPNLQLMEGSENESKNNTPFKKWMDDTYHDEGDYKFFMKTNYIPEDVSLEFKDFEEFYEKRKEILRNEIKKVLQ